MRKRLIWTGVFLGIALLGFIFYPRARSFPRLPLGSYVGSIGDSDWQRTVYVERVPKASALLFVVLEDAWKPQVVSLERDFSRQNQFLTNDVPYKPISLSRDETKFVLWGSGSQPIFRGNFESSDGKKGEWELRATPRSEIDGSAEMESDDQLFRWLQIKAEELAVSQETELLETELQDKKEKYERLVKYLDQKELLIARAEQRREELEAGLKKAEEEKRLSEGKVSRAVSELRLLGRITKRGKAVELARKVAGRENKWYLANWAGEGSEMEEFMQTGTEIDVAQFAKERKLAYEKSALIREIEKEHRRIQELQRTEPARLSVEAPAKPKDTKKQGFWDRLWEE